MTNYGLDTARAIALDIERAGGRAYFVGGIVRDSLMGVAPGANLDIDLEVYGIEPGALRDMLSRHGNMRAYGASFGVIALDSAAVEVSMPRRERATGRGHRDFDISVDPFLSPKEASARRDFTVNAMLRDALTGELLDPWGGTADIAAKRLRHVRAETFIEDPLRVYRAAQFAARFRFDIDPETIGLCAGMDTNPLPRERVYAETVKAFTLSDGPSVYFRLLNDMNQLDAFFPELARTRGVPQDPRYHPEGDVWTHTLMVLDEAAELRSRAVHPLYFMFAAICHDLGKPDTTTLDPSNGRIRSIGHETAGVDIARRQLSRLTGERALTDYVADMIELHMRPNRLAGAKSKPVKTHAMFDKSVCPDDLLLLSRADVLCTIQRAQADDLDGFLRDRLRLYRERAAQPMLTGSDLIAAGFEPGPVFSEMLKEARAKHFAGLSKEEVLAQIKGIYRNNN